MKHYCKVCDQQIPEGRIRLGYKETCVEHSSTSKYAGFVAGVGKVDYEVNIVRDPETAKHMQRLIETRGASC
jgi:hypothetical protein